MTKLNGILLIFLLFVTLTTQAQNAIKGTIIDKKFKEPLTGAAILVEGTTNGTTADIDGNYELKIGPGTYNLVVSYVSYKTHRFNCSERR